MKFPYLVTFTILLVGTLLALNGSITGLVFAPLANINSCTNITEDSVLTQDVTSSETCINITANNVVFDCQGFTIFWDSGGTGSDAIVAEHRTNITVKNCVMQDTNAAGSGGIGINLINVIQADIINNTVQTNGTDANYGIQLDSVAQATVANNTMSTQGTDADNTVITIQLTNDTTIINNTLFANGTSDSTGIGLSETRNNTLTYNTITTYGTSFSSIGISAVLATQTTISHNNIHTNGTNSGNIGISISNAGNNTITNNTITTNGTENNHGIELFNEVNNTVSRNSIQTNGTGTSNFGISFSQASRQTISENNIITHSTNSQGIDLPSGSENNTITGNIITTLRTYSPSIRIENANGSNFTNNTLNATDWIDVVTSLNKFINTTFMTPAGSIRITQNFTINGTQNISQAQLNITQTRAFLNSTNLTTLNQSAQITLENINTSPRVQVDLEDDTTFADCAPSTCTPISYNGSTFVFNVTHFSVYQAIDFCPVSINESTTLVANVTANVTCITFGADNIELDCQGNTIFWDANGVGGDAIVAANKTNITVRNCAMRDINAGGITGLGLNLTNSSNSTFTNNSIQTNGTSGNTGTSLQLSTNVTLDASIIQTTGSGGANPGISIGNTNYYSATSNTIRTGGAGSINQGIIAIQSNHSTISHNQINTSGAGNNQRGINLGGTNITIYNNTIYTSSEAAANSNSPGIVSSATFVTFANNNINANGASILNHGIQFSGGGNHLIANNTITTNGTTSNRGLEDMPSHILAINNTITTVSSGSRAVTIQGTNITLIGTVVTTFAQDSDSFGFLADPGGTAQIFNSTLNNTGAWIIFITTSTGNFTNTTFATPFGSIQFIETFTINGTTTVGRAQLNVTQNSAFLNSTNLTFLNTSARITFNNVGLNNPRPTIDIEDNGTFVPCSPPQCVEVSFSDGTFVFDVTHFTSYSSSETPESGSGGGSGGASSSTSTTATVTITQQTQTVSLALNQQATFTFNHQQHSLTINSFSANTATVTVQSTPKTVVLQKNSPTTVDVDDDGTIDIRLTYLGVQGGKAIIKTEILPREETTIPFSNKPAPTPAHTALQTPPQPPHETTPALEKPEPLQTPVRTLTFIFYTIALVALVGLWAYVHHRHLKHIK